MNRFSLPAWVVRFLGVGDRRQVTAISASPVPVKQGYPTQNSMSALAAFPWVRACVLAIVDDLSGLPLVARQEGPNGQRVNVPHPALDMLRRPSPRITGRRLRRQLIVDFTLTGNAYIYLPSPELIAAGLSPLMRLHPNLVSVEMDTMGLPVGYSYNGRDRYSLEQVHHVADVSWADDLTQAIGESAIRTLHDDLTAHKAAKEHAAKAAKRGRPEFLVSPKDADAGFGKDGAQTIASAFDAALHRGHGALVVDDGVDVTPLGLTARDLEFAEQYKQAVHAILAVFGVPPVRVGLPGANYGTAKTQMRAYWETLQHKAALFDDELSRLTGSTRIRIEHDFSHVDALQVARTERLERVGLWAAMGFDPVDAARTEGFTDPPKMLTPAAPGDLADRRRPEREPEEPQGTRRTVADVLGEYLEHASQRYTAAVREAEGDPTRFDLRGPEAERLAIVLESHVPAHLVRPLAERIATETGDAVAEHLAECAVHGVTAIDVSTLRAFGASRATTVARALARVA